MRAYAAPVTVEVDDAPVESTPVADPAAVMRARLLAAAPGRWGRLSVAGRLLLEHGDAARWALRQGPGDAKVDEMLETAGVPWAHQMEMRW